MLELKQGECNETDWFNIDEANGHMTLAPTEPTHIGEYTFTIRVESALGQVKESDF